MRTTWDVIREMDALRREVDRAFRDAGLGRIRSPRFDVSFLPGRGARAYPLLNVSEDEQAYRVEALAPGIDLDSLQVSVLENRLTVSGEKKATDGGDVAADAYHRVERAAGRFARQIALPGLVEAAKVDASYRDGILEITLPKAESARPREIEVRVS
jgi:HSP20 family protein